MTRTGVEIEEPSRPVPAATPGNDPAALIRLHYEMHQGGFVSTVLRHSTGMIVRSEIGSTPMWNHAAWLDGLQEGFVEFVDAAKQALEGQGQQPVVYVTTQAERFDSIDRLLANTGFEPFDEEAWMTRQPHRGSKNGQPGDLAIVEALDDHQLSAFCDVFYASYQVKDPAYATALKCQRARSGSMCHVRHFVAFADGTPVSIATLLSLGDDAGIYNVGTVPGARNRGYAGHVIEHLIHESGEAGHCRLFLQTTAGSGAERLYERLGFRTEFTRTGYRSTEWLSKHGRSGGRQQRCFLESLYGLWRVPAEEIELQRHELWIDAPPALSRQVRDLARQLRVHEETVLAAGWACVLSRYSGEEQVAFGLGSDGSARNGDQPRHYSITVQSEQKTGDWLKHLDEAFASENEHGVMGVRTEELWRFETLLSFGTTPADHQAGASATTLELKFPADSCKGATALYATDRLSSEAVRQLARHLFQLIQSMASSPQRPVLEIEMLSDDERHQLLNDWSGASLKPAAYESLQALFERQAEETPEAMALIAPSSHSSAGAEVELTYWQLNRRANQLAHHLRSMGVGPDVFVGICLERSAEAIIALLAVTKAGGAIVPLDPSSPEERLGHMVRDTRMPVLLTSQHLSPALSNTETKVLCIEASWETIACEEVTNPPVVGSPENIAYVIYTSGSTGLPKGVLISNSAFARHCLDAAAHYELGPKDRVLQFASLSFDAALEQIFPPLISGAAVIMRGREIWSPIEFAQRLFDYELSVIDLPTAYWHQLATEWANNPECISQHSLRLVIVGGEAMQRQSLDHWRQTPLQGVRLINAYGPTEATITATACDVSVAESDAEAPSRIPIGRPREGRRIYVLDPLKRPVPVGMAGELHIGGPLVARGYLNRPDLTKEKFIPDPFSAAAGARLYRTGDVVRYLPNRNLEFLGRLDDQVKVRGFRVELGEIEAVLNHHAQVRQAVVVLREGSPQAKRLIAYVIPTTTHSSCVTELRSFLKQKLPDYMLPSEFVLVNEFPLTVNGKVDRRALRAPALPGKEPVSLAKGPSQPLELRLQLLFERILNRRPVGVDVSFFELGGNSLQALEAIVGIERITGKNIPLETLYQTSTVEGLARILQDPPASPERSCLIPLQASGSRPPFIFIHTTPGDVLGYGNLIYHLSPDQPCYGFQSLGLCDPDLCHGRIEEMAEHYVGLLRSFQPEGPYYLGGWCYGGIVAVEMARILINAGQHVALLALFETVAPAPSWNVPQYYLHRFGCLLRMSPDQWRAYLSEKAKYYRNSKANGRAPLHPMSQSNSTNGSMSEEQSRTVACLERVYETNMKALKKYRSSFYPGRVTLFNAGETDAAIVADPQYGWAGLAAEIEVHTVPGNHDTMLAEPHAATLAEELESCLRRAQNRSKVLRQIRTPPLLEER
jgi:amino acid adenylation domain-containing protein